MWWTGPWLPQCESNTGGMASGAARRSPDCHGIGGESMASTARHHHTGAACTTEPRAWHCGRQGGPNPIAQLCFCGGIGGRCQRSSRPCAHRPPHTQAPHDAARPVMRSAAAAARRRRRRLELRGSDRQTHLDSSGHAAQLPASSAVSSPAPPPLPAPLFLLVSAQSIRMMPHQSAGSRILVSLSPSTSLAVTHIILTDRPKIPDAAPAGDGPARRVGRRKRVATVRCLRDTSRHVFCLPPSSPFVSALIIVECCHQNPIAVVVVL